MIYKSLKKSETMQAVIYEQYGDPEVLKLRRIPIPKPKENEVRVKIHTSTITSGDIKMRGLKLARLERFLARLYLGYFRPKRPILGMEIAGEIDAVGQDVTRFQPGDLIMGSTLWADFGGYAEYKCLPEDGLIAKIPEIMTYISAAPICGGAITACLLLKKANIQKGQSILIFGASGSVGTYAIQIAKALGAQVTGVCSGVNSNLIRSLGAEQVIDYKDEEWIKNSDRYDIILDAVNKLPQKEAKSLLKPKGIYLNVETSSGGMGKPQKHFDNLTFLIELIEAGKLKTIIDKQFALEKIIEGHTYVETGHKKGNVVVTIGKQD